MTAARTGKVPPNAATSTVASALLRREREAGGERGNFGRERGAREEGTQSWPHQILLERDQMIGKVHLI